MKTFEEFLEDKCPCHTNNSPEGFENWLAELDVQDVMDYAESYGELVYLEGQKWGMKKATEIQATTFDELTNKKDWNGLLEKLTIIK